MPNLAKKRTNRRTHFFLPKSAIFLVKSAHFLTPQTIFIAFLCINFFQISNFALFFLFSIAFFYIFLNKGLFCCFIKAHKNFSRRHQPFKVAPMCAKAHMFRNSGLFGTQAPLIFFEKGRYFTFEGRSQIFLQK